MFQGFVVSRSLVVGLLTDMITLQMAEMVHIWSQSRAEAIVLSNDSYYVGVDVSKDHTLDSTPSSGHEVPEPPPLIIHHPFIPFYPLRLFSFKRLPDLEKNVQLEPQSVVLSAFTNVLETCCLAVDFLRLVSDVEFI